MSTTSSSSRRRLHKPSTYRPSSSASDIVPEEGERDSVGALSAGAATATRPTSLPRGLKDLFMLSTGIKLLLFPAYRSTDFEVHRNWLAITRSLPMNQWYYDTTSQWSMSAQLVLHNDYPPFFAHFEHLLSYPAFWIDPLLTKLSASPLDSPTITAFQRSSVIASEALVLGTSLAAFVRHAEDSTTMAVLVAALGTHPGWLIIDHIHFQYNGAMFGILLWSIFYAKQSKLLLSGALFAVLLNFKHIYIYMAPPYFVYLLRAYCMTPSGRFLPMNFAKLGATVLAVFAASLGPFIHHLPQLGQRLFPFTRGLNHAYWAGNVWSLVTLADRAILKFGPKVGLKLAVNKAGVASSTRGFVGDTVFAVLPNVKPMHCFLLTVALQMIFSAKLWYRPTYKVFVWALAISGYTSFLFGWHVHEKAVLLFLVPLSLLAAESFALYRTFVLASVAGIFSLFPLLFTPLETPIKIGYSALWCAFAFPAIARGVYRPPPTILSSVVHALETVYLTGFPVIQLYVSILAPLQARRYLQPDAAATSDHQAEAVPAESFLPLLVVSTYCAVGLVWAWFRLAWIGLSGGLDACEDHLVAEGTRRWGSGSAKKP